MDDGIMGDPNGGRSFGRRYNMSFGVALSSSFAMNVDGFEGLVDGLLAFNTALNSEQWLSLASSVV